MEWRLKICDFPKPTDPHENFRATCHHCTSKISGSLEVTSNFVTHIKVGIFTFITPNSLMKVLYYILVQSSCQISKHNRYIEINVISCKNKCQLIRLIL